MPSASRLPRFLSSAALPRLLAVAVMACCGSNAMAGATSEYLLQGTMTYWQRIDRGPGTFELLIQTAGPLSETTFTQITAISGTYLGRTVTGLSNWYGADNLIRNSSAPFTFDGLAFTFAPAFPDSLFPGQQDNVADLYVGGGNLRSLIGTTAVNDDFSSLYNVSGFTITAVPEPATYGLMGLGLLGLAAASRRRARQI